VRTRFAPAPTGYLHLGQVVNAIYVWGIARTRGAGVLLRIEDHDRIRCRPEFEQALLEDLDWLGFTADADSTDRQVALARMLGRDEPPEFVHHPLILKPDGEKLSKSASDTGVRELRAAGLSPADVIGRAAAAVQLIPGGQSLPATEVNQLFG
jgi:glutamyl/glutaminyl-tRNA synthetase